MSTTTDTPKKSKLDSLTTKQAYLILVNFIQFFGWFACVLAPFLILYIKNFNLDQVLSDPVAWITSVAPSLHSTPGLFLKDYTTELIVVQSISIIEVLHAALGIVRAPLATTFVQVLSRLLIVGILYVIPETRSHWSLSGLALAWGVTEVIRYQFYALGQANMVPYTLTWLRYTLFYVLYPLGVSMELFTLWNSRQYLTETVVYVIYVIMASYAPGFYVLYTYMMKQRKKVLGGKKKGSSGKANSETVTEKKTQ